MDTGYILSFISASLILAIMPGPDNLYVLTESISKGARQGLLISLGLVSGVLVHTLAAATGLSLILQSSAIAFSVIKYMGAAYLFYLAYQAYREEAVPLTIDTVSSASPDPAGPLIRRGFLMNVLNPKVSLFFIAFLPQFITPGAMNITLQMILLGILFMLCGLAVFTTLSLASARLSGLFNTPRFWKLTRWLKIGVLAGIGLYLAIAER